MKLQISKVHKAALLLICLYATLSRAREADAGLSLEAVLNDSGKFPSIEYRISNTSAVAITIYQADLPWGNRYSTLLLLARPGKRGSIIEPVQAIDVPRPELLVLEPNQVIAGKIDLSRHYPNLVVERQKSDLLLFWSYRVIDTSDKPSRYFGGMFHLPRNSL